MNYIIDLQYAIHYPQVPSKTQFETWVAAVLKDVMPIAELTIRIVSMAESALLNQTYRHKSGATNILSFPFENEAELETPLLGDLVICAELVTQQAHQQAIVLEAHWAHLTVHGTLHLLGYDHVAETDAQQMETTEINILTQLGYPNPYGD